MNRVEKILLKVNKSGRGLEIGPSHSPIAPKCQGFNVEIIDCMNRDALIEYLKNYPVNTKKIEEIDYVWRGESYSSLTNKKNYYDWIISSHSIEHTTDLIGFLNNCDEVLKENGVLTLAIPDKRYCFDYFRSVSGIGKVIDYYENKKIRYSYGTHIEYGLNYCERDGEGSWSEGSNGVLSLKNNVESVLKRAKKARETDDYTDAHEWCFTYNSFRLMMQDLYELGFIKLREVCSFPASGNEFYITLGREGDGTQMTRLQLLEAIDLESVNEQSGSFKRKVRKLFR